MSVLKLKNRNIDEYGRVSLNENGLVSLLKSGKNPDGSVVQPGNWIETYIEQCIENDEEPISFELLDDMEKSVEDFDKEKQNTWSVPQEYKSIDVLDFVSNKCNTEVQLERVQHEWSLYKERDLEDILRVMIYLVDTFRKKDIVWGVGRGSSVSSYILFLIGVHKIDSLKYDLDVEEFLR